jgi:succinate-semialdehyde dehydrogenase/glutarate-semialdehyde dehydrogenase
MGFVAFEKGESRTQNGGPHAETSIRSYAPASGELLGEIPIMTTDEIRAVVARARKAQAAWGVLPLAERCDRLLRLRDAFVDRADELVEIITKECGKPRHEALGHEVFLVCDLLTWYCKHAPRILAPREIELHLLKHRKSYVHHTPRGVIGVISPWNYPFSIPMSEVVSALITGSAAVVKPSEVTSLTMLKAKAIFDSTGLPEDLLGVAIGFGPAGQALIESDIQKLVFTGGVETGRRVAAACGARLIPCGMELGGKAPLIACADAAVERTARAIVFGGFSNSGQACISVERVYAHEKIHDELVGRVKDLVGQLRQGDPSKDYVDVGAIIFPKQMEIAEKHIDDALAHGAELIAGGHRKPGPGQFFEPTVLANCNHQMTVMTQEIFGPIVPIQRVTSDDEAVDYANQSHLGLNAYVFTKDRARGQKLAERIEAGSVVVNDVLVNYGAVDTPFGGMKQSGFGRVHGEDALRDMAETRHVNYDRIAPPSKDPLWFPYSAQSFHWMMRGVRVLFSGRGLVQRLNELF